MLRTGGWQTKYHLEKKKKQTAQHLQMFWLLNLVSTAGRLGGTTIKNGIGADMDSCTLPWESQHGFCKGN